MKKGIFRLSILIFFICWITFSFYFYFTFEKKFGLLYKNFSPWLGYAYGGWCILNDNDWCVIVSKDEYIKMSPDEKMKFAEAFFEKEILPLARDYKVNILQLKKWFLENAVFVENQPIKESFCPDDSKIVFNYRKINIDGLPMPRFHLYFFNVGVIGFSFICTLIFIGILVTIYKIIRWVYLGFKEKS